MPKIYHILFFISIIICLNSMPPNIHSGENNTEISRETLRGIHGVYIYIGMEEDLKGILTTKLIKTDKFTPASTVTVGTE